MPIPRFLQNSRNTNGQDPESHASKSVYFKTCHNEGETREFQIVSTNPRSGVSVFRCTICGFRVEVAPIDPPAKAENNKKE